MGGLAMCTGASPRTSWESGILICLGRAASLNTSCEAHCPTTLGDSSGFTALNVEEACVPVETGEAAVDAIRDSPENWLPRSKP